MAQTVLARMAVQISANTAEFSKAINRVEGQLKGFQGFLNQTQKSLVGFAAGFSALQIGREIIRSFTEFQYEMSKVQAITGASGKDFKDLRNNAIQLGGALGFTSKEVASLQLEFGRLGFSTKEILNSSKAAVLLSKATGEDLAKSAEIAGSTLRSFNLDASEMNRIADVMAAAFNKTALGLSDFGEAIKYVAPVAANAGLSLEQVSAMLGVLADNGIKGSMAGTSLRKIISDLGQGAAPMLTKKLGEMAKAGLSGADAMDEVGRTAYASLLILSKNTAKVDDATKSFQNVNGELQKMADIMTDNVIGDWDKLTASVDAFIQTFGEGKDGIFRTGIQALTKGMQILSNETLSFKQKLIALGSVDADEKLKKWGQAFEDQARRTRFFSQHMINEFGGIQNAIDEISKTVKAQGGTKGTWFDGMVTSGQLLDELNDRLTESEENVARGLKAETDAAVKAAMAFNELTKSYSNYLKSRVGAGTPFKGTFQQGAISTPQTQELDLGLKPEPYDFKFNMGKAVEGLQAYIDKTNEAAAAQKKLNAESETFGNLLSTAVAGSINAFSDAMYQSISAGENFGDAFLKNMAGFMKSFGQQLIAIGVAKAGLDKLFVTGYGAAFAIAAGIALVAAAGALSASAAKSVASISNGGSGSYVTSSTSGRGRISEDTGDIRGLKITIDGEFKIRGKDLVAAIKEGEASNQLTRG